MTNLTIKNIPESVYKALKSRASSEKRSINSEVIMLLESALISQKLDKNAFLERVRNRRKEIPALDMSAETIKKSIEEGRE